MNDAFSVKKRDWTAVASIGLASFVLITTEFLPVGVMERLTEAFQVRAGTIGLMVTIPGLVAAVAAPLATVFAGKLDRRLVLAISLALITVSNLMVAVSAKIAVALLGRGLLGLAVGIFWSFCIPVGRRLVPDHHGHEQPQSSLVEFPSAPL